MGLSLEASRRQAGRTLVFRCGAGHLFRLSRWWWLRSSWSGVRFGFGFHTRCPVGKHWSRIRRVDEAALTEQERQNLASEPVGLYEGEKINGAIGLFVGAFSLTMSIVTQSWWLTGLCVAWIAMWGAVFFHARRELALEQREPRAVKPSPWD
jgi:hypothetical protein